MYERVVRYRACYVKTVRVASVKVSCVIVFLVATLLRRAGDIEMNPGPMVQTRLNARNQSSDGAAGEEG